MKILFSTFLFFLGFQNSNAIQFPVASQTLYCNKIYGNFNNMTVNFQRALQDGDVITWSGTVATYGSTIRYNLYNMPALNEITFHMRQDLPIQHSIFNNYAGGHWGNEMLGPSFYQIGSPY